MAETTKKTATKKSTATKATTTPAKKTTRKTTAARNTSARSTARPAAKKTTKKTTARRAPQPAPLFEREPVVLLETAGYAATSLVSDAITLVRNPERIESHLASLRTRLGKDLERTLASFTRLVDHRADDGRKVVDNVAKDERVSRVLDQTANTRSQLKAAFTSVTRTADVAGEAASKQADTARSQVKGAATSVRTSTTQSRTQVKGAATSVRKIADAAVHAASKQAPNAASQLKAAATSVRKTAGTVVDAAVDTAADAEAETAK